MAIRPGSVVRSCRARFTRLDQCGTPVEGECGQFVTAAYVSAEVEPDVDDGEAITERNACGDICVNVPAITSLLGKDVTIELCEIQPELFRIVYPEWGELLDENGELIGPVQRARLSTTASWALELWDGVGTPTGDSCTETGEQRWWYFGYPWIKPQFSDESITHENGLITITITGRLLPGGQWGVGPYNIRENAITGDPAPLPYVYGSDTDDVTIGPMQTTLPPPDVTDGCETLTPIEPPALEITSAVEDTSDATGMTTELSWTNWGAGSVTVDWADGTTPVSAPDTGTLTHQYAAADTYSVVVTDADDPARTDTVDVTVPYV